MAIWNKTPEQKNLSISGPVLQKETAYGWTGTSENSYHGGGEGGGRCYGRVEVKQCFQHSPPPPHTHIFKSILAVRMEADVCGGATCKVAFERLSKDDFHYKKDSLTWKQSLPGLGSAALQVMLGTVRLWSSVLRSHWTRHAVIHKRAVVFLDAG